MFGFIKRWLCGTVTDEENEPKISPDTPETGFTRSGDFFTTQREYTVYKSTRDGIVELTIPAGVKVFDGSRKKRAEKAIVTRMFGCSRSQYRSHRNVAFTYSLHEQVIPRNGLAKEPYECAGGIHFFTDILEAIDWHMGHTRHRQAGVQDVWDSVRFDDKSTTQSIISLLMNHCDTVHDDSPHTSLS